MNNTKKQRQAAVFIETYGCQMNKGDSEIVAGLLQDRGYIIADSLDQADIVLINTCSVRANAEQRALGRAKTLSGWKREGHNRRLGIIGCMAQRLGDQLIEENPFIDLVAGPDTYRMLPQLLNFNAVSTVAVEFDKSEFYTGVEARRQTSFNAWVTIMRGCNNYCAYCIVPFTRGRERSRTADEILREIEELAVKGYKEIILLGQNVNSFNDGKMDFADLLQRISQNSGIPRIRFMTSHPKDLSNKLLDVMAAESNICRHIHLPLQAGSDSILKAMNRKYTQAHYLDLIKAIRSRMPDAGITTDIMTGFPGETDADFNETIKVVEEVKYDDAFTYHFSPREGTQAAEMPDQIPKEIRLERLDQLIRLQRKITTQKKTDMLGHTYTLIPETSSKHSDNDWLGRTETDHTVVFPKKNSILGEPVKVRIVKLEGSTLIGCITDNE